MSDVSMLQLLPNCLMISIKELSASDFFCLIFSCNYFVSVYFSSDSVCLLATVIFNEASTFSRLTVLSVILSLLCFCSTFNICNFCVSESRTWPYGNIHFHHCMVVSYLRLYQICMFHTIYDLEAL